MGSIRLEDYALVGDCRSAALVANDGSIDWLCLPRFDSQACFAALLGDRKKHGFWQIAPKEKFEARRQYRDHTLILETTFVTSSGEVRVVDFMPPLARAPILVRRVEGIRGVVDLESELLFRLDYGSVRPWIRKVDHGVVAIGGPAMFSLQAEAPIRLENHTLCSSFALAEGQTSTFMVWYQDSHDEPERQYEGHPEEALQNTERWWTEWAGCCTYEGPYRDQVIRSLITLKALTYGPTGGIIAAPTTSLPEDLGGVRNWDYRYCWIRDSSLILQAFLRTGYREEAARWHDWLLRAVAGDPSRMQIMYGLAGERRLTETELDWLPGYEESAPVRIGNGAWDQVQLDIYGEVMTSFYLSRKADLPTEPHEWDFLLEMMDYLEGAWRKKDEGIWEVRGKAAHFTYSKFMCWVAFDHAIRAVEEFSLHGPVNRWKKIRDEIQEEVFREGFNRKEQAFVQAYGSEFLDASLLRMPIDRFISAEDPRMIGTIRAMEDHLIDGEFVFRYYPSEKVDGLPGEEGAFLLCSFWLADNYVIQGNLVRARDLYEKLLHLCNDVGLLSEEYCGKTRRLIGNFPQGYSHLGIILTALNLQEPEKAQEE
jgi:GH15 family glucan-1,4-alpha-glucosidase